MYTSIFQKRSFIKSHASSFIKVGKIYLCTIDRFLLAGVIGKILMLEAGSKITLINPIFSSKTLPIHTNCITNVYVEWNFSSNGVKNV
jgi:hypothetical protein